VLSRGRKRLITKNLQRDFVEEKDDEKNIAAQASGSKQKWDKA